MADSYKITGAAEMEKLLHELGDRVATRLGGAAARAGARVIVKEAKRLVPVRTGALKDSIVVQTMKKRDRAGDEAGAVIGFEKPESRRAHLIEFGTSHSAAQPFMRPAMDGTHPETLDAIAKALASGIEREAKKLAGVK